MSRKASIKNLRKAADDTSARVSELEKQLEEAKAKQAEAQIKVREREKEIQQEDHSGTVFPYDDALKEHKIGAKTTGHIHALFESFGYERIFGRSDVMAVLGLTATPASTLIRKMTDAQIVIPVSGLGKGKIRFKPEKNV